MSTKTTLTGVLTEIDRAVDRLPAGVARQLVKQLARTLGEIAIRQDEIVHRSGSKPWSHISAEHARQALLAVTDVTHQLDAHATTPTPWSTQPSPHTGRSHVLHHGRVIIASLDALLAATIVEALNMEHEDADAPRP